jgi:hypothetical protein
MDNIPELRTGVVSIQQQILLSKIFVSDDVRPKPMFPIIQPPDPLDQETDIHEPSINNPEPSQALRITHGRPPDPVVFAFGTVSFPEEARTMFIHSTMSTLS